MGTPRMVLHHGRQPCVTQACCSTQNATHGKWAAKGRIPGQLLCAILAFNASFKSLPGEAGQYGYCIWTEFSLTLTDLLDQV